MATEQQQLEAAIAALNAQRPVLGDAAVEPLLLPARARLAARSTVIVQTRSRSLQSTFNDTIHSEPVRRVPCQPAA